MNKQKDYIFRLKADNSQDLHNSTLIWKYSEQNNIQEEAKVKSSKDFMAFFEIKAKPGKIEYWYQNSQNENEKMKRKINLKDEKEIQVDKFNCYNVVLKCQVYSNNYLQLTQMYNINMEKQQKIEFNHQNLIYVPYSCEKVKIQFEYQDIEFQITEVQVQILFKNIPYISNSQNLEIDQKDLEICLFEEFKQSKQDEKRNIKLEVYHRQQRRYEDLIISKYEQDKKELETQSNRFNTLINQSQKLEQSISSFTKRGNFFTQEFQQSSTQNTINQSDFCQSQIVINQSKMMQEQQFRKTFENLNNESQKKQFLYEQAIRQVKNKIEQNNIMDISKAKQQEQELEQDQLENTQLMRSIILQATTYDNYLNQCDNQKLIKIIQEQDKMIEKIKQDQCEQINILKLQIEELNFQLNQEKEKIEEQNKNNCIKFIQNFRNRRFTPNPKVNQCSKSIYNLKINPILSDAKNQIVIEGSKYIQTDRINQQQRQFQNQKDNRYKTIFN